MSASLFRPISLITIIASCIYALPVSYPDTEGQPSGGYSPDWQSYFKVNTSLPGISFDLPTSYAGNIDVQREGHPNNTLFFWGFEKTEGSLADENNDEPWGIWLNGGPGSSSIIGLFTEVGPLKVNPSDNSISENPYAWTKLADHIFLDNPVGIGYSTSDENGYVADEDQLGRDFFGFLENLVKVFPALATRPLVISGESYAGMYIPYILKTYFGLPNPPVKIATIAVGDGTLNTAQVFQLLSSLSIIETFPQIIGYDTEVYEYFKEQHELCNYNITLQYPQPEALPYIPLILSDVREIPFMMEERSLAKAVFQELQRRFDSLDEDVKRSKIQARKSEGGIHKRDLSLRANGTIDPWYGCDLQDEYIDYAINYTYPWNVSQNFDWYDIPDALEYPNAEQNWNFGALMNDPTWREALHAPTSKNWSQGFEYTFGDLGYMDPSPDPMTFLSELAENATQKDVGIVFFSANNDALIAHRSTEVTIQNMTWGGVRGFTRRPSTPWKDDEGNFAGIIHQERGLTYALFDGASHLVPMSKPVAAFTFAREFIFGDNQLGLVQGSSVVGGEDPNLASDVLRAGNEIYIGAGSTQSTYVWPSETIAAWDKFIATATATP